MSTQVVSGAAEGAVRAEIDTSPPFESVKEAATRFGGFGFWRPSPHQFSLQRHSEVVDARKLKEEAAQLEKDLMVKERQTLLVLKELESIKLIVEELKVKVQRGKASSDVNVLPVKYSELSDKEDHGLALSSYTAPGLVLLELKQAKLNLAGTINDLADIRVTAQSYRHQIEKERISLEKTCQRLSSNASKISSLEGELNQTRHKLQVVNDAKAQISGNDPVALTNEMQMLISQTQEFKKMGEAARSEIEKVMSETEERKSRLKTAEISLMAAKKLKEAARASEAVALAEIKALSKTEDAFAAASEPNPDGVTLDFEEYMSLLSKAREAEESSNMRLADAMSRVDEASISKTEILKGVEEAAEEVKRRKKALEEALSRVEAANRGTSVLNDDECKQLVAKPSLSIGKVLRRKLRFAKEQHRNRMQPRKPIGEWKVSLRQIIQKW